MDIQFSNDATDLLKKFNLIGDNLQQLIEVVKNDPTIEAYIADPFCKKITEFASNLRKEDDPFRQFLSKSTDPSIDISQLKAEFIDTIHNGELSSFSNMLKEIIEFLEVNVDVCDVVLKDTIVNLVVEANSESATIIKSFNEQLLQEDIDQKVVISKETIKEAVSENSSTQKIKAITKEAEKNPIMYNTHKQNNAAAPSNRIKSKLVKKDLYAIFNADTEQILKMVDAAGMTEKSLSSLLNSCGQGNLMVLSINGYIPVKQTYSI